MSKTKLFGFLGLAGVAVLAVVLAVPVLRNADKAPSYPAADVIARPDVPDPVFAGAAHDTINGGAEDEWLFKQTARYPGTNVPRLVKTVFDNNKLGHLARQGNEVLYEFFREDGTLEHTQMVFPEAGLGGGVYTKVSVVKFDASGTKELEHRYFREDNTLGAVFDLNTGLCQQYRRDGKTLRSVQENVDKTLQQTYFRPDGKTPWWVSGSRTTKVYFDLNGKPFDKEFRRSSLARSFSMSQGDAPKDHFRDEYLRADGTVEYRQTWTAVWDKSDEHSRDALRLVEIMSADGKTVTAKLTLDLSSRERFIREVETKNPDGTTLVRTYRSPNCREHEKVLGADGKEISSRSFDARDSYIEPMDERVFHGFSVNLFGRYDDDTIDK